MKYFTEYKKILTGLIAGVFFFATGVSYVQAVPFADTGTEPATSVVDELATPTPAPTTPAVPLMMPGGATPTPTTPAPGIVASTIEDTLSEPPVTSGDADDAAFALDGASLTGNTAGDDALNNHFDCGITADLPAVGRVGTGNLTDCIPVTVYYLIYKPASFLLVIAGKIFDYVLSLSINNEFIQQPFVDNIWELMRDFANMGFIFILLYAGIATMLRMDDWTHTVKMVVIVALFINFSLLFTKVVIDAGNVLAVGIYSSLGTESTSGETIGLLPKREISGNLVAAFQPQNFIGTINSAGPLEGIVVFLVSAAVNIAVAWAFFTIALVFIGRIVGFWVLMMFSPIAFVSLATPRGDIFKEWLHNLLNLSFVAPVFLIFMYVILKIIENMYVAGGMRDIFLKPTDAGFLADKLFVPVILAIMLVFAIGKARDYAKHMAGEFGEMGSNIGGKVMGFTGGVALGGAAMAGRKVLGGLADSQMDRFRNMANNPNSATSRFVGRNLTLAADRTRNASFDARNISYVQQGAALSGINVGEGKTDGYVAARDNKQKEVRERELARANVFAEISPEAEAALRKKAEEDANKETQKAQVALAENQETVRGMNQEITRATAAQKQSSQELTDAVKRLKDAQEARSKAGTQAELDEADHAVSRAQQAKDVADAANNSAVAALQSKKTDLDDILEKQKALQEAATKAQEARDKAGDKAVKEKQMAAREQYALSRAQSVNDITASNEDLLEFVRYVRNPEHEAEAIEETRKKLRKTLDEQNKKAADEARKRTQNQRQANTQTPPNNAPPAPPVTP